MINLNHFDYFDLIFKEKRNTEIIFSNYRIFKDFPQKTCTNQVKWKFRVDLLLSNAKSKQQLWERTHNATGQLNVPSTNEACIHFQWLTMLIAVQLRKNMRGRMEWVRCGRMRASLVTKRIKPNRMYHARWSCI